MKKTVLTSTIYLITLSIISKMLSFIVRIILARKLPEQAMSYCSLAAPTMVFVITLAQMGIPAALSKVIAQSKQPSSPLIASIILAVINNLVIMAAYLILLPLLAIHVFKQEDILPVLYAVLPLIPLVTLSGILKGYLFGLQEHIPATASQLFEEGSRILFIVLVFYFSPMLDIITMAKAAMLSISIGEASSSLYMLYVLLRKKRNPLRIPLSKFRLQKHQFQEVLSVSIPMMGSRIIGSLTYFLEPIAMVIGLSQASAASMVLAYGQLNGYVLPIITMPSFITVTLSNYLLPSFTYSYTRGYHEHAMKLFRIIISCCLFIGICCSLLCYFFPEQLLNLFYHNTQGAHILKQLAIPFALYSLQPPLSSMLHALSLSSKSVRDTLYGSITRILCILCLTSVYHESVLPIALTIGMLITTLFHAIRLYQAFRLYEKEHS